MNIIKNIYIRTENERVVLKKLRNLNENDNPEKQQVKKTHNEKTGQKKTIEHAPLLY